LDRGETVVAQRFSQILSPDAPAAFEKSRLEAEIPMGEVVFFDAASKRSPSPAPQPTQQMPYETYVAYRQAEAAFRAIYFGRPLDLAAFRNRHSARLVEQHWPTVEQLAETLQRKKELSREQVTKLLLRASLDAAVGAEA
jgi:hypothetical protein